MTDYYRRRNYLILLEGIVRRLDDDRLTGWTVSYPQSGHTLMEASAIDSAALYGSIAALRERGIVLLKILWVPDETGKGEVSDEG
jgi:hypothetical protein